MTQMGGRQWAQMWTVLSSALASAVPADVRAEQHLATEAVVAYVDGELSIPAHERATRHVLRCALCTAEVAAQRQARAAVRAATAPAMPSSLLASLHAIPQSVELPSDPGQLSIDDDGQFVVAQRPLADAPPRGMSAPLGSRGRLGSTDQLGSAAVGPGRTSSRRVRNSAGVVLSGLVLGALALSMQGEPDVPWPGADSTEQPVVDAPARFDLTEADVERPLTVTGLAQR